MPRQQSPPDPPLKILPILGSHLVPHRTSSPLSLLLMHLIHIFLICLLPRLHGPNLTPFLAPQTLGMTVCIQASLLMPRATSGDSARCPRCVLYKIGKSSALTRPTADGVLITHGISFCAQSRAWGPVCHLELQGSTKPERVKSSLPDHNSGCSTWGIFQKQSALMREKKGDIFRRSISYEGRATTAFTLRSCGSVLNAAILIGDRKS